MKLKDSFPPEQAPIVRALRPFQKFAAWNASGGVLLFICAVVAMAWANSPWAESYDHFWHTTITIGPEGAAISNSLLHWINDGLMAVFFFVVGLEIKREILVGELSGARKAALPIAAAAGGVVAPALIYAAFNFGSPGIHGWGVPIATDIAFALGVMALLGDRAPAPLKVFLTALAIADDLMAVLVIAVFYTSEIGWMWLGLAGLFLALLFGANMSGARRPLTYAVLGTLLWMAVLKSGVHATIAGVLLAFTIPARQRIDSGAFLRRSHGLLDEFEVASNTEPRDIFHDEQQQAAIHALEQSCEQVQPPLLRFEHELAPWVNFFIMPVFALANAGITFAGAGSGTFLSPISLGVAVGLLLGKPIGITAFAWLVTRAGLADLPAGIRFAQIHAVSWLGGIGFTMSLFIAGLAFRDAAHLMEAKMGIFLASGLAAFTGTMILKRCARARITR
jgi:Na+:H+ antiporter, NhaA family